MSRGRKLVEIALKNNNWEEENDTLGDSLLKEALCHDVLLYETTEEPPSEMLDTLFSQATVCFVEQNNSSILEASEQEKTSQSELSSNVPEADVRLVQYSDSESDDTQMNEEKDINEAKNEYYKYTNEEDTVMLEESQDVGIENGIHDSDNETWQNENNFNSSESDDETSDSSVEPNLEYPGRKKAKHENTAVINKRLRLSGKPYQNYKKEFKQGKIVQESPCKNNKACKNKCAIFTDYDREAIFRMFWNLKSNNEKRAFINGCVNVVPIKRKRTKSEISRRSLTYQYFFIKAGVQHKVCLQFFIATLNITQKVVRKAIEGKICENLDKRGQHQPVHKINFAQKEQFKNFIESLPLVPSHYCRSSSNKMYLGADIKSVSNLYRMYSESMRGKNQNPVSFSCFKSHFKTDYNIGIHVPRKDKCNKCEKFKNIAEDTKTERDREDYSNHQKEKNEAKMLFLQEQSLSTVDNHPLVVSFDLQKCLSTPHGPNMLYGYSRKYAVYNFTVYESKTQEGYCYIWGEKDGKRGAVEICSHLFSYLKHLDALGEYKSVSFYCDNCPGQNKNRFLMSMLKYFLTDSETIEMIKVTFLVAGHTYMPVDSVHAVIEKHISKVNIEAPSEWPTIIRNARKRPRPYHVIICNYKNILDWKVITTSKKLKTTEGREIKVTEIKTMQFQKNKPNSMFIKFTYDNQEDFTEIDFVVKKVDVVPRAYKSELAINKKKLENLLTLCRNGLIQEQYHQEYRSLISAANVPDCLPESDIDDEEC